MFEGIPTRARDRTVDGAIVDSSRKEKLKHSVTPANPTTPSSVVSPSPPPSPPATASALLLHDSKLLRTIPLHARRRKAAALITLLVLPARTLRWLEPLSSLRVRRSAVRTAAVTTAAAALMLMRWSWHPHHLHERIRIARVDALRHHLLHHLLHLVRTRHTWHRGHGRHTGWHASSSSSSSSSATSTRTTILPSPLSPAAEESLHLRIRLFLLGNGTRHRLLPHAVLRPRILIKAVVEEIRLVRPRQTPGFGVLGQIGVDVDLGYGFAVARPEGRAVDVDLAVTGLGEVFAFFVGVGEGAFDCCRWAGSGMLEFDDGGAGFGWFGVG